MLINNAGVVQGKLILDLSPEDVQQCVVSCSTKILVNIVVQNLWCKYSGAFLDSESVPSGYD